MEFHSMNSEAASDSGAQVATSCAWPPLQYLETVGLKYPAQPLPGPGFKVLPCDQGSYLISDELNHRILKFDSCGELVWQTGGKGSVPGNFWYPRGIATLEDEIYVCDSWNHRIQVLDMQGRPIRTLGRYGSEWGQFNECSDIEVDESGKLWVVDTGNHCLKVLSTTGQVAAVFGRRLSVNEEQAIVRGLEPAAAADFTPGFFYPHRIVASYIGGFCIDDRGNQRISLVSLTGRILACLDSQPARVTRHTDAASLERIAGYPLVRLRMQLLEVVDWSGALWHSLPAVPFSEVCSRLTQISGKVRLQIYCHSWTIQSLLTYALDLPAEQPPGGRDS